MAIPTILAKVQQLETQISLLSTMPQGENSDLDSIKQRLGAVEGLVANNEAVEKINSVKNEVAKIPDTLRAIEAKIKDIEGKISALPTAQTVSQLVAKVDALEKKLAQAPAE